MILLGIEYIPEEGMMPEITIGFFSVVAILVLYALIRELPNIKLWWAAMREHEGRRDDEYRRLKYVFTSLVSALQLGKPGLVEFCDDGTGWKGAKIFIPKTAANFGYDEVLVRKSSGGVILKELRFDLAFIQKSGLLIAEVAVNLRAEDAKQVRLACILQDRIEFYRLDELDTALHRAREAFGQVSFLPAKG